MSNRGWMDAAVAAASALFAAVAILAGAAEPWRDDAWRIPLALAGVAVLAFAYLLLLRPARRAPDSLVGEAPRDARTLVFVAFAVLAAGAMAAAIPYLAMSQALIYPLVWVAGSTRRRGIWGSALVALAVFFGFWAGGFFGADAAISGAQTAVASFLFSVWFGSWISSISEYGEERARLLAELQRTQAENEALSAERGAAGERERLARDIHDTLAQTLAGLVLLTEGAERQLAEGQTDAAASTIATVQAASREAHAEARALVTQLAALPASLAFDEAIARLAARFEVEAGIPVACSVAVEPGTLDREAQVVLLRCAQEGLANVRKHADASAVELSVTDAADPASVTLTVADDGRGFDPAAPRTGFGLDGIADRVSLAGGAVEVRSSAAGTSLTVTVPRVGRHAGQEVRA